MAVMIPSTISPEVKSNAERRIFRWFENAPGTDKWIVLHSLGIATHNKVIYGETDFLVLAPRLGIFALEVKGGRVRRENGIWHFTDRYGHTNTKSRGPFEQAKDGIFSIVDAIKKRVDYEHSHIQNILFGYGVMFPDIEFTSAGVEEEQWQVFDSRDEENVKQFITRLSRGAKEKWESHYGPVNKSKYPDYADVKYMASLLRGDFDCTVSMSAQLKNASEALIALTKEQYLCLDQLDDNPRCLIMGPAGTGKTLLAVEEVKRAAAHGERVALFCYNANLSDWLISCFADLPETIRPQYVGTIHKYMIKVARESNILPPFPNDPDALQEYYQKELPEAATLAILDIGAQFDRIVLDEAQDLIHDNYLEFLDATLEKGLSRGQWTLFGDFSMQAIYSKGQSGDALIGKLDDITSFIRFKLTINCRNTKPICKEIETVTGFQAPNNLWTKVDGPPVQYITWATQESQKKKLETLLKQLSDAHIKAEQITILSPRKKEDSVISMLEGYKIKDFKIPLGKDMTFCTIQSFKGLENTIIILVDVDSFSSEKLMYVGLSRACSGLFILESESAKHEYNDLLVRRLLK